MGRPTSGFVDFNTKGSSFDTLLAVYTNSTLVTNVTAVAANDDDAQGGGVTNQQALVLRAGQGPTITSPWMALAATSARRS